MDPWFQAARPRCGDMRWQQRPAVRIEFTLHQPAIAACCNLIKHVKQHGGRSVQVSLQQMLVWVANKEARGIAARVWRAGPISRGSGRSLHPLARAQVWRSHGLTALGAHQNGVVMDGVAAGRPGRTRASGRGNVGPKVHFVGLYACGLACHP